MDGGQESGSCSPARFVFFGGAAQEVSNGPVLLPSCTTREGPERQLRALIADAARSLRQAQRRHVLERLRTQVARRVAHRAHLDRATRMASAPPDISLRRA